ncbi:LeoA/HP0731 family dynamin-like GTPase [Pseudomonas aeruginosa]|uniref:LeoA/HP0731 family dynamin-like GTPase n=1 Tax=Pseudomonas aeruginosa group TaxID=136841 RepID=UPI000E310B8D|nr:LeoA/HP0731 family dynamin-like GTPase [Pseudomonas aeruginosa]EIU3709803.1 dynamin family protein [Pseudomonas aeruginosa]EIU3903986.1 dynamin family protein [Pseudomonas aeruginosa]EKV3211807.1 dynamin family protein [Pseudomonas aeruginosa]MDE8656674.1 dynamin family protein [Pseudomonas aeruginosa]MDE8664399.1 dynamin family protein [Pseudomonas aeruginosa]
MEQFTQFSVEKQAALGTLEKLRGVLDALHEMGVGVEGDLQKITSAMQAVESDVLRIALLGAFSDGKTSVIAAWLGKVMEDMKISMDESSDRLAIYKPEGLPGQCEIVDTPGLFGDKEKEVDGEQVMYEDLTKRYISEAHLILYVVDATNPLKDSHSEIAKWVLRDLNKLSSTVFVINKMDEVTDLTEQVLFEEQAAIKKENLKSKLQRAANLSLDELTRLNIVCIASNPNGRGLEFWFGKPVHYESRSRINDLKSMTGQILQANVSEVLIAKTGLDVVRDIVGQRVAFAKEHLHGLELFAQQHAEESRRFEQDIQQGRREVKRLAGELASELQSMEAQLLGRLRPLSLEDIRGYLEDELGYTEEGVGYKLHLRIKNAIDRFFDHSSAVTKRLSDDIARQLNSSESFISAMSEGALNSLSNAFKGISNVSPEAIKSTIFIARDTLGKLTGYVYKFKPWEATKLAGNISKWTGPAGAVVSLSSDLYGAYKVHELEQELKQVKDSITSLIKGAFKDIYDLLSDDEKTFDFFAPQIKEVEKVVTEMSEKALSIRKNQEKLISISSQLEQLRLSGAASVTA